MPLDIEIQHRLKEVFTEKQASVLTSVISSYYDEIVKRDFNELKEIVREIAEEQREIAKEQRELVQAQKRTEIAIQKLTKGLEETRE